MKKKREQGMLICEDIPPNYQEIKKFLPGVHDKVIFTWGNIIYNPRGFKIDPGLMRHEQIHFDQQVQYGSKGFWIPFGYRVRKWWHRYLRDPAFRLSQELPAYQVQLQVYAEAIKSKEKLHKVALMLAKDLSGPLYGSLLSTDQAYGAIRNPKLYKFRT